MDTLILHEMYFMNFKYHRHDLICDWKQNKSIIVFKPFAWVLLSQKGMVINKGIFIRKWKWIYTWVFICIKSAWKSIDCLNTTKRKLSVSPVCVTRRLYEYEADLDWIPVLRSVKGINYYLYFVLLNTIVFDYWACI